MALAGDPTAMRLCMERVLPPCRERTVKFSLPPIEGTLMGGSCGPSTHDVSQAMNAVASALAQGEITPGETETIAGVVDTFVRAIETTKKQGSGFNLLEILMASRCDDDNSEDNSDRDDYEEAGDYQETDDCGSWQGGRAGRADMADTVAAPGSGCNQYGRFCCRFAAGAISRKNPFNL